MLLSTRDLVLFYQNPLNFDHYLVARESATALGPEHANLPFRKFSGFRNCGIKPVTPITENTEVSWSKTVSHAGTCLCVCVCVHVYVCNIRIIYLKYIPLYYCCLLSPSSQTSHYPRYTPTMMSPLLYADYYTSLHLIPWPRPILSSPGVFPRFNPAKARPVPSLSHLSAQVASRCTFLYREVREGAGC